MKTKMKKFMSLVLATAVIMAMGVNSASASAVSDTPFGGTVSYEGNVQILTITGEENIRAYQESMGEEYDPNLLEVHRRVDLSIAEAVPIEPYWIIREYYVKNKSEKTATDYSSIIKEYKRPAGTVKLSETVSISNTYSASAKISAEILETTLGFSVTETNEFEVEWSQTYSYPIRLVVYPIYKTITGEIWDEDVNYDDYVGDFTVKQAVGDDVRVYRQ